MVLGGSKGRAAASRSVDGGAGRLPLRQDGVFVVSRCSELESGPIQKLLKSIRPVSVGTNEKARRARERTNQSAAFVAG